MTRNNFLKQLGINGAALMAVYCGTHALTSCKNEDISTNTKLTLDLTDPKNSSLKTIGGYLVLEEKQLVIAKVAANEYVTVTRLCTHENQLKIIYKSGEFYCEAHQATYNHLGKGTKTFNENGTKGIQTFPTTVEGNIITINI
ncbi:MAG: Rieske 2Fe-2S domain-containing protein [Pseudarcicella sp.]|nr:Rieske 2Fe-2S domain-containing protein [Pseudarcicella sp.]MBP6410939.1 Rieske 2Fe-2S domain-containing protein [Pseudarcicella sp.]